MSNTKTNVTLSLPIFGVIGLILVILKLGGVAPVAAWSWWVVTLPFWFGIALFAVVLAVMVIIALFVFILAAILAGK